jgi:hypothetical protein
MKIPANGPIISQIRRGSIAHRSGALQCGDQLLEICGTTPSSEEDITRVLSSRQDIVSLKVLKGATFNSKLILSKFNIQNLGYFFIYAHFC